MGKRVLNLLIFVTLSSIAACDTRPTSDPIEMRYLYGKYIASMSSGSRDELLLKSDGTYVRYFVGYRGDQHRDSGDWEFSAAEPDNSTRAQVVLSDFRVRRESVPGSFSYFGADKAVLGSVPQPLRMNIDISGSGDNQIVKLNEGNGNSWVKREEHARE